MDTNWQRAMAAAVVLASATLGSSILGTGVASATDTTIEKTFSLSGLQTIHFQIYSCPDNAKFLTGDNFTPGRIVPPGIEVIEPGGVGVSMHNQVEGSATNWDTAPHEFKIIAHCTSDPKKARYGSAR